MAALIIMYSKTGFNLADISTYCPLMLTDLERDNSGYLKEAWVVNGCFTTKDFSREGSLLEWHMMIGGGSIKALTETGDIMVGTEGAINPDITHYNDIFYAVGEYIMTHKVPCIDKTLPRPTMSDTMTTGKKLKYFRVSRGLSQAQLEDLSGIRQSFISCFEKGSRKMNSRHIRVLSSALGISESEFNVDTDKLSRLVQENIKGLTDTETEKLLEYVSFLKYLRGKHED